MDKRLKPKLYVLTIQDKSHRIRTIKYDEDYSKLVVVAMTLNKEYPKGHWSIFNSKGTLVDTNFVEGDN